jgi:hypothetical protein
MLISFILGCESFETQNVLLNADIIYNAHI